MGRSPCCDESGLKKGPWTPEEDSKLIDYIQKHGHGSWRALPKHAGILSLFSILEGIENSELQEVPALEPIGFRKRHPTFSNFFIYGPFFVRCCRAQQMRQELQVEMDKLLET